MNGVAVWAEPALVVRVIRPVIAPLGTRTLAEEDVSDVIKAGIALPLPVKLTVVPPAEVVKLVPVNTTALPTSPLEGLKPVIAGPLGGAEPKFVELVAVPPAVVTVIGPVPNPAGTVTVNWLLVAAVTVAGTVPPAAAVKVTVLFEGDVPSNRSPLIVIESPGLP